MQFNNIAKVVLGCGLGLFGIGIAVFALTEPSKNPEPVKPASTPYYSPSEMRVACENEVQEKFDSVDRVLKDLPNATPQQVQNLARNAGITDENNFVIDKDILVRACLTEKERIWNQ